MKKFVLALVTLLSLVSAQAFAADHAATDADKAAAEEHKDAKGDEKKDEHNK